MHGVFSLSLLSCFLYNWRNRFFQLPFNGGHFVADSCSCFCSMLVCCTTEETGFPSCHLMKILLSRLSCSCFCSMLVCCMTEETGFSSCQRHKSSEFYGCCFFPVLSACLLPATCTIRHSSCHFLEVRI